MDLIALVAENKIEDAIKSGEFDHLPGHGKPVTLDDFSQAPVHLRVAFKILKNAGVLPVEMELRKEMADLRGKLARCCNEEEQKRLRQSLNDTDAKYQVLMERHTRRTTRP